MAQPIDKRTLSLILSGRTDELNIDSFSPEEWDLLVEKAQREGVAPLVYWVLSKSGKILSLPQPISNHLRAIYFSTRMKNEQSIKELETIASAFAQAGIPVVALKGICFALTIYPDPALRPMVDLDILVPASKTSDAVRIARSSGYVEAVPEASPGLRDLLNHETCLKKIDVPFTTLEIHHSLVADRTFTYAVPTDWFWNQMEPLSGSSQKVGLENVLMLTPTAQILYASAHAMLQHGGRNTALRWYYDLDRLMRVYAKRIDWDLLLSQARSFEWSSAVSAALSEVVSLFETPIPEPVLKDLSKHSDRNTSRVMTMQDQPASHTVEEYQKLKSLNWYGRIKLIIALTIPSPAYMRWRYGLKSSWALPLWYLYRWWGISKDAIRTVVLLIRRVEGQGSPIGLELDRVSEKSH